MLMDSGILLKAELIADYLILETNSISLVHFQHCLQFTMLIASSIDTFLFGKYLQGGNLKCDAN